MDSEAHADVALSPKAAWERLAALDRLHEWAPDVTASPSDPLRVGAVRRATLTKPAFGKPVLVERVVGVDAPRSFTYDIEGGIGPLRTVRTTWSVAPVAGGARVTVSSETTLGGLARLMPGMANKSWTRQLQALVDGFAAWADGKAR